MTAMARPTICSLRMLIGLLLLGVLTLLPQQANAQLFYAGSEDAYNATKSYGGVLVVKEEDRYWGFLPQDESKRRDVGFIYHTNAFFDERAYSEIMRPLAARGYPVFIIDEPLSLAYLAPFRADLVIRDYPELKGWVVGGHGVGGQVASCYAQWRGMNGLALFSSTSTFPFSLFNTLKFTDIEVISLWGSNDGVTSRENWESGKATLPDTALFEEISGGNFSFMASLKNLVNGDNEASISQRAQQRIVVDRLLALMLKVQNKVTIPSIEGDEDEDKSPSSDDKKGSTSNRRFLRTV